MPDKNEYKRSKSVIWALCIVGLFQSVYGAMFILKTSFIIEGRRWFCLFDDAMISMRYAKNWACGNGLVWNAGEYIEGYSNFAWTLVLGLLHMLQLNDSAVCLPVQLLGIVSLWALAFSTYRLAQELRAPVSATVSAICMAGAFYNFAFFGLLGMETVAVAVVVSFGIAGCVRMVRIGRGEAWPGLWFALGALLRTDVALLAVVALGVSIMLVKSRRMFVVTAIAILVLVVGAHFVWRNAYYGDWMPNTYYLKLTGWPLVDRVRTGAKQTVLAIITLLGPLIFACISMRGRTRAAFVILLVAAVAFLYNAYIGGDAWPMHRFILPVLPGVFVLSGIGIAGLSGKMYWAGKLLGSRFVIAVFVLGCVLSMNLSSIREWALLEPPALAKSNIVNVKLALAVKEVVADDAVVAVGFAGAFPYFSDVRCVDMLGKCETAIARMDAIAGINRPGHNKFDFEYTDKQYKPDIVLHAFGDTEKRLLNHYRPSSVHIDGDSLSFAVRRRSLRVEPLPTSSWESVEETMVRALGE